MSMASAARLADISYSAARAKERGLRDSSGKSWLAARLEESAAPAGHDALRPVRREDLGVEALKALDDFGYFRRRYFGRISTPWQEEAGHTVVELKATKQKEFVVINCPPGSGKTTLFTHDIPVWLTCRDRAIRGTLGHRVQTIAESYLRQLRLTLESPVPFRAEAEDFELGLAVDAVSTVLADFGLFKPQPSILWSNQQIIVAQEDGRPLLHKEATWSAFGLDTTYIGVRSDVAIWDDPMDESDLKTLEGIEQRRRRWDKVPEKRLEPAGVLVMPMQRLGPEDLSRYCLDKPAGPTSAHDHECCDAEPGRKYHHIKFKAHYVDRCREVHGEDAAYYPEGCLLDPRRLPWPELEDEQASDEATYETVYQQEDADQRQLLVPRLWIDGGTDPATREIHPGCWDLDRGLAEFPSGLAGPKLSVVTADPSPTKFWAIGWWIYTPQSEFRWLMDLERKAMEAPTFLDWNQATQSWTGLMEEWWQRSNDMGYPITVWVVEQNAAQRFMLQYDHVKRWQAKRGVRIIGHETQRNKADPKMGVTAIAPHYRYGRIRLPGRYADPGRVAAMHLYREVTKWPLARYDDCVMMHWFLEWNLPRIQEPDTEPTLMRVPSFLKRRHRAA